MPINMQIEYPKLEAENIKLKRQRDDLLDIAKTVSFWFNNEANYPEGTAGYKLGKKALKTIERIKNEN